MSTCPQCYTGTCKRHRRQDHGRSLVKSANAASTLQKMYDQLVGSKLQKLQAEAARDPTGQHSQEFRRELDASRDKSLRKSRKSRTKLAADVTGSGLNPQALAAIYGDSDSDSDSEEEKERHKRKKDRKKHKHKHASSSSRKRKHRSDSSSDSSLSDDSSDSDDARRRPSKSSRKHSHHKKSHKTKKHKRSRTNSE